MPQRIQRRRDKGWTMPEGVVYVGRPSVWGNPFNSVHSFRAWLAGTLPSAPHGERRETLLARLPELRGKDLACWCAPRAACHADVLIELANREEEPVSHAATGSSSLLPCPFCGSARVEIERVGSYGTEGWVRCRICRSTGPYGESAEQIAQFWNRRRGQA